MANDVVSFDVPSSNGSGTATTLLPGWHHVFLFGSDFDSGTFTVEVSPDSGSTWITALDVRGGNVEGTGNAYFEMLVGRGEQFRVTLASAAGSDNDVTAQANRGSAKFEKEL